MAQIRLGLFALLQPLGAGFAMAFLRGLTLVALPFLASADSSLRGHRTLELCQSRERFRPGLAASYAAYHEVPISLGVKEMYPNLLI